MNNKYRVTPAVELSQMSRNQYSTVFQYAILQTTSKLKPDSNSFLNVANNIFVFIQLISAAVLVFSSSSVFSEKTCTSNLL